MVDLVFQPSTLGVCYFVMLITNCGPPQSCLLARLTTLFLIHIMVATCFLLSNTISLNSELSAIIRD